MAICGWCGQTDLEYAVAESGEPAMLVDHMKPKRPQDLSRTKCTGFGENYSGHLSSPGPN